MSEYTREEFNRYKGDKEFLTVDYEYPKGNWESIDHVSYEDYISIFNSYVHLYQKDKSE